MNDGSLARALDPTIESSDLGSSTAREGVVRQVISKRRERDPELRQRKLEAVLALGGLLACEVCRFDFQRAYGDRGSGYIEVHHKNPLHVTGPVETYLEDLVLLCANCHRMIHRGKWITVDDLSALLRAAQAL